MYSLLPKVESAIMLFSSVIPYFKSKGSAEKGGEKKHQFFCPKWRQFQWCQKEAPAVNKLDDLKKWCSDNKFVYFPGLLCYSCWNLHTVLWKRVQMAANCVYAGIFVHLKKKSICKITQDRWNDKSVLRYSISIYKCSDDLQQ